MSKLIKNYSIMIYVYFVIILVLFSIQANSYSLISLGSPTIPTKLQLAKIDNYEYNKLQRDESGNVSLAFQLEGAIDSEIDKIFLQVNHKDQVNIEIIKPTDTVSKGQKIYITKELKSNSTILLNIKFTKFEYIQTGLYKLEIVIKKERLSNISHIFSSPIVNKFTKPKLGLEGDPMRITCAYDSYPNATEIRWEMLSIIEYPEKSGNLSLFNSTVIFPNDRIQFISGKDTNKTNDTLYITKLLKTDTGFYKCVVISPKGEDLGVIKINVKDRWAALYPFIGIVIEVILLVTAILAYEKYQIRSQNKKNYGENVDEDNKDPDMLLTNRTGYEENVPAESDNQQVEVDGEKVNNVESKQREAATTKNV